MLCNTPLEMYMYLACQQGTPFRSSRKSTGSVAYTYPAPGILELRHPGPACVGSFHGPWHRKRSRSGKSPGASCRQKHAGAYGDHDTYIASYCRYHGPLRRGRCDSSSRQAHQQSWCPCASGRVLQVPRNTLLHRTGSRAPERRPSKSRTWETFVRHRVDTDVHRPLPSTAKVHTEVFVKKVSYSVMRDDMLGRCPSADSRALWACDRTRYFGVYIEARKSCGQHSPSRLSEY